jgi:hypothetical protein
LKLTTPTYAFVVCHIIKRGCSSVFSLEIKCVSNLFTSFTGTNPMTYIDDCEMLLVASQNYLFGGMLYTWKMVVCGAFTFKF